MAIVSRLQVLPQELIETISSLAQHVTFDLQSKPVEDFEDVLSLQMSIDVGGVKLNFVSEVTMLRKSVAFQRIDLLREGFLSPPSRQRSIFVSLETHTAPDLSVSLGHPLRVIRRQDTFVLTTSEHIFDNDLGSEVCIPVNSTSVEFFGRVLNVIDNHIKALRK